MTQKTACFCRVTRVYPNDTTGRPKSSLLFPISPDIMKENTKKVTQ